MPPIDLAILNATQLDVMRAKAALDKAEASLAAAQAKSRDAEAAIAVAARLGDRAAETKARQAAERAAAGVMSNRQVREGLFGDLRDRLYSLIRARAVCAGRCATLADAAAAGNTLRPKRSGPAGAQDQDLSRRHQHRSHKPRPVAGGRGCGAGLLVYPLRRRRRFPASTRPGRSSAPRSTATACAW